MSSTTLRELRQIPVVYTLFVAAYPISNGLLRRWQEHGTADPAWLLGLSLATCLGILLWALPYRIALRRHDYAFQFVALLTGFWCLVNIQSELVERGQLFWQWGFALAAFLSAVGALAAMTKLLRSTDEMQREINYKALAFAFTTTLGISIAYAISLDLGLNPVSPRWLPLLMSLLWITGVVVNQRRYR